MKGGRERGTRAGWERGTREGRGARELGGRGAREGGTWKEGRDRGGGPTTRERERERGRGGERVRKPAARINKARCILLLTDN